jgi:hypothetical protein
LKKSLNQASGLTMSAKPCNLDIDATDKSQGCLELLYILYEILIKEYAEKTQMKAEVNASTSIERSKVS